MKKKIIIGVLIFLSLLLIFFSYKTLLIIKYKVETDDGKLLDISMGEVSVRKSINNSDQGMTKFENIIYKKQDDKFVYEGVETIANEYKYETYYLYSDDSKERLAVFRVGKADYNLYDSLSGDVTTFGFSFKGINVKSIFKKFDITDDYTLMKYIVKHYNDKPNILYSSNKIKMDYLAKTIAGVMSPNSKIILISGDYKGYMYASDKYYEVRLTDKETSYILLFLNSGNTQYFNMENVKEAISKTGIE